MRDFAPLPSARPLHEIESGWRRHAPRPPVSLPCVCDGPEIVVMSLSPEDIADGVRRHQIEPVHIAWDEAHGIPLATWQRVAVAVDGVVV